MDIKSTVLARHAAMLGKHSGKDGDGVSSEAALAGIRPDLQGDLGEFAS